MPYLIIHTILHALKLNTFYSLIVSFGIGCYVDNKQQKTMCQCAHRNDDPIFNIKFAKSMQLADKEVEPADMT